MSNETTIPSHKRLSQIPIGAVIRYLNKKGSITQPVIYAFLYDIENIETGMIKIEVSSNGSHPSKTYNTLEDLNKMVKENGFMLFWREEEEG